MEGRGRCEREEWEIKRGRGGGNVRRERNNLERKGDERDREERRKKRGRECWIKEKRGGSEGQGNRPCQ